MDKNVYIVGFMGTGKTTVGKLLAKRLNRKFIEMDEEIEKRENKKIVDIFSSYGESYFRKVEKEVLKEIAGRNNLVVSCGGGIVIDRENLQILKTTGIPICLEASVEVIYERTKNYTHRPLLNVADPKKKIEELLVYRAPFYQQISLRVDTSGLNPSQVVDKIMEILKDDKKITSST
ncbi:MAG: shikimate kinase [Candidatus Omnitrophica bacterium]|nr:shikimate kinase [Candidatus Omnitrophota bacterium]